MSAKQAQQAMAVGVILCSTWDGLMDGLISYLYYYTLGVATLETGRCYVAAS